MPFGRRRGTGSMSGKASVTSLIDQTRQRLGLGMAGRDKTFVPTPNVRNPQMLAEAEDFERHLWTFEGAARRYHDVVQRFLYNLIPLLNNNLPRVWVAVEGGLCEPVRSNISHGHPSRIGGDYDDEGLRSQLVALEQKLSEDILAPLKRWHEGLAIAKERMESLDRLRSEVDRERLAADKKFRKSERRIHKAYARGLHRGGGSSSSSSSEDEGVVNEVRRGQMLEDYTRLALVTERKLGALTASYADQERLVWEQLAGLVRDAAWLESYIVATMLLVKEAMQGAALMMGPTKQPLPAYKASRDRGVEYGGLAHNMPLVSQMAPRASELASGAAPRAGLGLQPPLLTLRAHRGVATPLSVGVSLNARAAALEYVPDVAAGAGHVPLALVGPEIQQEAQRVEAAAYGSGVRVVEPGSSLGTPRGTATPPALMAPPSISGSERGRPSSTSAGISPGGGASPRVRRVTDSSADEIPLGSTRVRRVTDASEEGLPSSGAGSYSRSAPATTSFPSTSSSRFGQGGLTSGTLGGATHLHHQQQHGVLGVAGGLSAGAAKGWQKPSTSAAAGSNMQREPSFTPMGGETYPSAADMQQVVPRSGPREEGGVTGGIAGDVSGTNGTAVSAIQKEVEGSRHGTPAAAAGVPSMTPLGGDDTTNTPASPQQQLPRPTHATGVTKTPATHLATPSAAAPAGDDSLQGGMSSSAGGATGGSSKVSGPPEVVKEELSAGAAAAGQELVFRPYPGQQAPGFVPHSHPVATA